MSTTQPERESAMSQQLLVDKLFELLTEKLS
jgi:hypothetical protein